MSAITVAIRDFGYSFEGRTLFSNAIGHMMPKRIVGRFRDERDAAEYLIPIIHDDEFTRRVTRPRGDFNEANHRNKTCKRKQMRRQGLRAKVNINTLFA